MPALMCLEFISPDFISQDSALFPNCDMQFCFDNRILLFDIPPLSHCMSLVFQSDRGFLKTRLIPVHALNLSPGAIACLPSLHHLDHSLSRPLNLYVCGSLVPMIDLVDVCYLFKTSFLRIVLDSQQN